MNPLLKAAQVAMSHSRRTLGDAAVRPLPLDPAVQIHQSKSETADAEAQIQSLRHKLAELEQVRLDEVHVLKASEQAAHQRGFDEGVTAGVARAVQDHAAQLAALRAGVQDALADFRQRLQGIETLSLDVTQAALEKIFGDRALCAALVVQTAKHHLSQVAAGSAIGVRVSAMDFPQPEQLQEAFTSVTQHTRLTVHADPHLASGACLIQLTLGCLDVSLPQQLSHVTAAISTLYIGDRDEH